MSQWESLSASQRKRYIGAARTGKLTGTPINGTPSQIARRARSYYVQGGSLTSARGKHPSPTRNAPPRAALQAAREGRLTNNQITQLENWQRRNAPSWIRDAGDLFSEDTAAILAGVNLLPQNWSSVDFYPQPDGSVIGYFHSRKGGPDRKVVFPDRTMADQVREYVDLRNGIQDESMFQEVSVRETDARSVSPNTAVPTKRVGKALPRKRK